MSQAPTPNHYAVGQRWACKGRHADEQPTLLINRIERHPIDGGNIYHVTLDGLKIRHPGLPGGYMTKLDHAPVTDPTLQGSALRFIGEHAPDPAHAKGYAQWRAAFDAGNAGSFGVSTPTILEIIERRINGIPLDQP